MVGLAAVLVAGGSGCKKVAVVPDDAGMTTALNQRISGDGAISGQPVQGSVQGGVATLTGSVANDAEKTIAARDAESVAGVKSVNNQLVVGVPTVVASAPLPPPVPVAQPAPSTAMLPMPKRVEPVRHGAPIERQDGQGTNPDRTNYENTYHPPLATETHTPAPPPPAIPVYKEVTVAAGSSLAVRFTQTLDSATAQAGDNFSGTVASDVIVDGVVAIPQGAAVTGTVTAVQEAAHFKGSSLLTVSLTGVRARGERLPVSSDPYTVAGKGRGKNTAEKAGGGAAVGAILGGIFGGGKGAAIGAAAGGGVGAGANAVTRGEQVQIESESVVRFHTSNAFSVRVRTDGRGGGEDGRRTLPNQ